jgi:hypothetical protein
MTRSARPALLAGYAVAFAVALLALVAAFGYLGPIELVAAGVLAIPVTALGARLLVPDGALDLEPDHEPLLELEALDPAEPAPATAP